MILRIFENLNHFSSKNDLNTLMPVSQMCFSTFHIIVNWIYLDFGLLVGQNKQFEGYVIAVFFFFLTIFGYVIEQTMYGLVAKIICRLIHNENKLQP